MVMQQLMEQSPLPMLLMRTVIQALTMYPRLGGFVMNILSRLIMKQIGPVVVRLLVRLSVRWSSSWPPVTPAVSPLVVWLLVHLLV